MPNILKALQGASGNAGEALYVEDVFSTYLYTGNGSTQTITNGIDLDGEGGLVWIKNRDAADSHILTDVTRGAGEVLSTDTNTAGSTDADTTTAFNSDGFSIGADVKVNTNTEDYASWTFRKAPGFFDVVPFTGDGNNPHTVSHNLGSVPGFIVIRRTDSTGNWCVAAYDGTNYKTAFSLNSTAQAYVTTAVSNIATDTTVDVGWMGVNADGSANVSGGSYVMYLFASDAGGFGDDGSESIIKCGSFTGGTGGYATVDLGFEPQWIMIKGTTLSSQWVIYDTMRGWVVSDSTADDAYLFANLSNAEGLFTAGEPNATGFRLKDSSTAGETYIYIAIRRPMKTPESGTEVFTPAIGTTDYIGPQFDATFSSVDLILEAFTTSGGFSWVDRVRGDIKRLKSSSTAAEIDSEIPLDMMYGAGDGGSVYDRAWMFKRATGFFDVVAYTGDGVNGRDVIHNLKVLPEFVIIKERNSSTYWLCWHKDINDYYLRLNDTNAAAAPSTFWDHSTYPVTSTSFPIGTHGFINGSGDSYIAYLFATLAGVSKVGSYTGTAANIDIDCGFSAGARFILIKRTDSTGDWYVWDSERGIVAGNDPYILLNSIAAEVTTTDYIDPLSSGFTVTSSAPAALNASGGTYIFLAIS